jgi:hypothetical protein
MWARVANVAAIVALFVFMLAAASHMDERLDAIDQRLAGIEQQLDNIEVRLGLCASLVFGDQAATCSSVA